MSEENGVAVMVPPEGLCTESMPEVSDRLMFHGIVPEDVSVLDEGKSLSLLIEKKVQLTHEKAVEILELPEFIINGTAVDRPLEDARVAYLINCIKRGTFHPEWVILITCTCKEKLGDNPGGTEYRMNGQHTCWARLGVEASWPCEVKFQKYHAKTIEDMRRLYASIDRGYGRSKGQVLTSYLAGSEQFAGLSPSLIKQLCKAFSFWMWEEYGERRLHDADSIADIITREYTGITAKIGEFMAQNNRQQNKALYRSPIIAAMYETFGKVPTIAAEFWESVGEGTDLSSRNDPRLKLRTALTENVLNSTGAKRAVSAEAMYCWCIHAWNAWRRNEELTALRGAYKDAKRPVAK